MTATRRRGWFIPGVALSHGLLAVTFRTHPGLEERDRMLGAVLAQRTGKLARFLIFGSFVSAAPNPCDVDVILVMAADFKHEAALRESQTLFSHADAEARFGASIFWLREGMLPADIEQEFFDTWQTKRDGTKRGIVEVRR